MTTNPVVVVVVVVVLVRVKMAVVMVMAVVESVRAVVEPVAGVWREEEAVNAVLVNDPQAPSLSLSLSLSLKCHPPRVHFREKGAESAV